MGFCHSEIQQVYLGVPCIKALRRLSYFMGQVILVAYSQKIITSTGIMWVIACDMKVSTMVMTPEGSAFPWREYSSIQALLRYATMFAK